MDKAALLARIKSRLSSAAEETPADPKWVSAGGELRVVVPAADLVAAASFLKESGFDLLTMVTAVDWIKDNRFELVYYFQKSGTPAQKLFLKTSLPRTEAPSAPTLTALYAAADWQEREIFDLFGIRFEGHPDLRRILLWEGYPGYPLRKDYVHTPDMYDNGHEIGLPKPEGGKAAQ